MSRATIINGKLRITFPIRLWKLVERHPTGRVEIPFEDQNILVELHGEEYVEGVTEGPVFRVEEPVRQNIYDLEYDEEHWQEAISDEGWLTREEFMAELQAYEERFGLSSEEFYEKWQRGEMPDRFETNVWASLYQIFLDGDAIFKGEVPLEWWIEEADG